MLADALQPCELMGKGNYAKINDPGSGKSLQGPQGSSCSYPHFTRLSSLGPDCFTPSPSNSQARQAGRHFLRSPRGGGDRAGRGRGEGEERGGGAKTRLAATASELAGGLDPELLNSSQSLGSRARVSVCAQAALGRGDPGLLHGGRPGTCPAPHAGRPRGSSGCDCSGLWD
ncbi:hypothetical protein LEMLEM_LOCUS4663 [Lemmus lemmus]